MHVVSGALTLDLKSFAVDQNGKNVRASQHRIELDVMSIEPAAPTAFNSLEFEPVRLSVNRNFVDHVSRLGIGGPLLESLDASSPLPTGRCYMRLSNFLL